MKRLTIPPIILLVILLVSACIQSEVSNSEAFMDNLDIDLSKQSFHEIYNLSDSYFINDVTFHKQDVNRVETESSANPLDIDTNVVSKLIGIECTNSTINDTASVKNNYDYIVDFKISNEDGNRLYSVSIGDAYLLVSLVSETEKIVKHEISNEDYESLLDLLSQ